MIRRTLLLAALLAGAAACDSPTESSTGPTVQVALTGSAGMLYTTPNPAVPGQSLAQCDVTMDAVVTGKKGATATWQGAKLYLYSGMNRSVASDSTLFTAAEVAQGWSSPRVTVGDQGSGFWTFAAPAPFKGTLELRFKDDRGNDGTTSFTFTCGPTPPASAPAAPVLSNIAVSSDGRPVDSRGVLPGRDIVVTFSAHSASGLWETGVVITGAFEARMRFNEQVAPGTGRGAVIRVPSNAPRGQPINIQIYATDAFLQTATGAPATQVVVMPAFVTGTR